MSTFYLKILNKDQVNTFHQLSFLEKLGFYLAGGTALALQLGHRTSLDFDFYNPKHFSAPNLYDKIEQYFKGGAKKIAQHKDTLTCQINNVDLSFFWYQYPLIEKLSIFQGVSLASLKDIAAMKLVAIGRRPAQRDYIDIFYLLGKFTFEEMFSFAATKYPTFNSYMSLRTLTYFEDLDQPDQRSIKILDPNFSWPKAKDKIFKEVKKYQLSMLTKR